MAGNPYSPIVMDHFMNPRNVGEIPDADGVGQVGSPLCGDLMKITIKVVDGRIADIKFLTFGCCAAIASSSMATEMIKGKTIEEALTVTNQSVVEALGGLPEAKVHCSVLAEQALRRAIDHYLRKTTGKGLEADALNSDYRELAEFKPGA
ncbi:MAG: Fe-S cluster assembly scaffold protein NifU [Candidatus Sumerlaeia bacterium]|nr:Fe-S cluster assembly scaffold protein NifU [Candidatus Sumerlaeia bacterium]